MKIDNEILLDFNDILIKPKRSIAQSRAEIEITREFKFYHSGLGWKGFPLIAANMASTGTVEMARALMKHGAITCLHKFHKEIPQDCMDNPHVWISTGMEKSPTLNRWLYQKDWDTNRDLYLCIDVANGYTNAFCDSVKRYREDFPNAVIMAGNVATPEMVQELILSGADIVKIGIGPGSACQTRMVTGVGIPQISACLECAEAAHGLKSNDRRLGLICLDGGMRTPGDICKSFAAGADFVMSASLFVGTDECVGERENGYYKYYGMSSYMAQEEHYGQTIAHAATEGKVILVKEKGPVDHVIKEILGGVRSCCSYIGATCLKDMNKCGSFVRVNRVHDTPDWRTE